MNIEPRTDPSDAPARRVHCVKPPDKPERVMSSAVYDWLPGSSDARQPFGFHAVMIFATAVTRKS